jgi:hypothetical protein
MDVFDDPNRLLPQDLDEQDSRRYEERTIAYLLDHMKPASGGLVQMDTIELLGSRPDTLVVFRYHHRAEYLESDPTLAPGPHAEVARLWDFAIDDHRYSRGMMYTPPVLAAEIGSAFDAAELTLVDPKTLQPIGSPPKVFPRYRR